MNDKNKIIFAFSSYPEVKIPLLSQNYELLTGILFSLNNEKILYYTDSL